MSSRDSACFGPANIATAGLSCGHRHTRPCRAQTRHPKQAPLPQTDAGNYVSSVLTAEAQLRRSSSVASFAVDAVTSACTAAPHWTATAFAIGTVDRCNGPDPLPAAAFEATVVERRQPFESTAASTRSGPLATSRLAIAPTVTATDAAGEAGSASGAAARGWWRRKQVVRASLAAAWAMTCLRPTQARRGARRPQALSDKIQTLQSRCTRSSRSSA